MSKSKKPGSKYSPGDSFCGWMLEKSLGAGGNGDVWQASKPTQEPTAIKILRSIASENYERFKIEIASIEKLGCVKGVVPLLEKL